MVGMAIAYKILNSVAAPKTMALHHRSKQYEIQHYQTHTLSWKPIAHADEREDAIETMRSASKRKAGTYRVLDRKDGVDKAVEIAKVTRPDEPYKRGTAKVRRAK